MNMKKLFPEKKFTRKGVLEFLDRKGFYIVLILCIAIVGATAIFVTTNNISSSNKGLDSEKIIPEEPGNDVVSDVIGSADTKSPIGEAAATPDQKAAAGKTASAVSDGNKVVAQNDVKTAEAKPKSTPAPKATAKPSAASKKNTGSTKNPEFIMPVFGTTTYDYSMDKLVYSKTLDDWRTHSGVDLAAERGATVKAVADGVVSEIKSDPRLGIVIILEHQNGLKTVYANLASDEMVVPNQKVKQGDIIGCVGNTALFESAEESHLHFEVLKDNEPVNPASYLPKK